MYLARLENDNSKSIVVISIAKKDISCSIECDYNRWIDYVHQSEKPKIYDLCEDGGSFIDYIEMFNQMTYDMYEIERFTNWILGFLSTSANNHSQTKKVLGELL